MSVCQPVCLFVCLCLLLYSEGPSLSLSSVLKLFFLPPSTPSTPRPLCYFAPPPPLILPPCPPFPRISVTRTEHTTTLFFTPTTVHLHSENKNSVAAKCRSKACPCSKSQSGPSFSLSLLIFFSLTSFAH